MKKTIWILAIALFFYLIYKAVKFNCEIAVKCGFCSMYSDSKEESVKKAYFAHDYKPIDSVITLKNHEMNIEFTNAFAENAWHINTSNCFNKFEEKANGVNLIINYKKSIPNSFLFKMIPIIDGEPDSYFAHGYENYSWTRLKDYQDTVWFQVFEKNPDEEIGWREEIKSGKIAFIKVKNKNFQ